ncbi:FtsX-like permease family protein [Mucilaginibacter corticis]|uniref:FtsX-like permease family protein n=1 Tax=Mucilaginibacter corticis TaxID=2597670 RepID=A0A556MW73_9SPHI|nr:ABC transporter permease [Mucilaginibacter corticis]TSJ44184.1 FtsX-like permease family protein [Mucilaginibacter corticis]
MIKNYFKIALYNFRRHKLLTFINVIGLSIGISASLVIFLIVYHDFTFDKFHKDKERIYRVVTDYMFSGEPFYNKGVTGRLPDAVKNEVTGIENSAPVYLQNYKVNIPGPSEIKLKNVDDIVYADKRYFDIFSYTWLAGSATALNQLNQVVLSADQAKKYFPALSYQDMLGKQVVYDDSIRTTVCGIIEPFTENTDFKFHDFISYATIQTNKNLKEQQSQWAATNGSSQFFVKLTPASNVTGIEQQLRKVLLKYQPDQKGKDGYKTNFRLQALNDIHFNENYHAISTEAVNKPTLYGLMVIGLFLLALACINFINLTTAQASQRTKEIGIRKTMGSTRLQLIGQFLSETFFVTLLAVIISVALVPVVLKLFSGFISAEVKFNLLSQPVILLFALVLLVVVSFISGFYPALVLSRYQPVKILKNQFSATEGTGRSWLRKSLTVTQFAIAQFFIIATLVVSKQIYYALHKDLGFKKEAIVYINIPWKNQDAHLKQVFINKIKSLSQVELVSLGGDVPSSGGWSSNDVSYRDGKKEIKTELYHKSGDENYIKIYQIKLLAGRNIKQSDTSSAMLINTTYAHILGFTNPADAIGKLVFFDKTQKREIVGIVGDFHQASLHAPIKPMAIYPEDMRYQGTFHIALKPQNAGGNDWKTAIAKVQAAWKSIYPDDDFDYHFFDESIIGLYNKEQHISQLLSWATGLSVFISCLGLFGLAVFTTNQRTKEIGVRKVLGASVTQIVTLLSTELVYLVMLSFVIICPVSWLAMHKWMQGFADRTSFSWWIFAISGAGIFFTALFTLSFQTIKAAIANPVKSLRSE